MEENLQLAQIEPPVGWSLERVYDLFPRLGERRKQEGTTLSGGEQQMLAIGRALARDIKLLLDEPYEGLAPVIVQEIEKTLHLIREQGITTVIVEQNFIAALNLADRAIILDTGQVVMKARRRRCCPTRRSAMSIWRSERHKIPVGSVTATRGDRQPPREMVSGRRCLTQVLTLK